eukprot:scaffold1828_cov187-Ochromonas_danica.AAC.10
MLKNSSQSDLITKEGVELLLGAEIRRVTRDVRQLHREVLLEGSGNGGRAVPNPDDDEDPENNTLAQAIKLEEEKKRLEAKYQQTFSNRFEPSSEHLVHDFLEFFFQEIDRPDRRIVETAERIAFSILRKFEGLMTCHEVKKIVIEESRPGILLTAKIEDDRPRKVLSILEFIRSKDPMTDLVICKEVFVVQDARPLYHFDELPPPIEANAASSQPEGSKAVQEESSEEKKEGEDESDEDGEYDDEEDDDEYDDEDEEEEEGEEGEEGNDGEDEANP